MKLTSIRGVKNLLRKYHLHPSKKMGQNFLIDRGVIKKIIESAQLSKNDIILEIGPGIGNLTLELAKKAKKVIAVEKDQRMIEILKETLGDFKNVEIIHGDILKLDPKPYTLKPYKVVANLPFYLTAPVIRKFLEAVDIKHRASACGGEGKDEDKVLIAPQQMVLVVQKEVAQRICAKPPDMSLLAVSVQFYVHPVKSSEAGAKQFNGAEPEIIAFVSKKSFWPTPGVDGAILKISALNQRKKSAFNQRFFRIVKAGFSQPRKQLINNLTKKLNLKRSEVENWLTKNQIKPTRRAETLTVENWISLTKNFNLVVE